MLNKTWQKAARTGVLAGVSALTLAACATSTPYEAAGKSGYGFSDQKIEDDRYRITFRGNSLTDRDQVETYLLFRAAELTLESGFDHFVVVEDDTEKSTSYRSTGGGLGGLGPYGLTGFGPGFYNYYGFGRPFPYYGFGYPWGAGFAGGVGFNDVDIRERNRYSAVAYVKMGRGEKPADVLTAYDAAEVATNLAPSIRTAQGS